MKDYYAPSNAKLCLEVDGDRKAVDLYSDEGFQLLSLLTLKVGAQRKTMYEPTWLGRPIIQFPNDVVAVQELLWRLKPDLVVETGVAHGGSLVLTASILELIGHGRVVGIDIEIRPHNREAIQAHTLAHRISLLEGSSISADIISQVHAIATGARTVVVILDSNHSTEHVHREMELYAPLVTLGSYLVTHDGAQALVGDIPRGKPEWKNDNPLLAIERFTSQHTNFEIDNHFTRFGTTSSPRGFLKKVRQ